MWRARCAALEYGLPQVHLSTAPWASRMWSLSEPWLQNGTVSHCSHRKRARCAFACSWSSVLLRNLSSHCLQANSALQVLRCERKAHLLGSVLPQTSQGVGTGAGAVVVTAARSWGRFTLVC